MSDDNNAALAAQFCAITGLEDPSQASMYLEMSGGNLETAIGFFFETGGMAAGGGVGDDAPMAMDDFGSTAALSSPPPLPDWFRAVWPSSSVTSFASVPESWSGQTLEFGDATYTATAVSPAVTSAATATIALDQAKNGPCGVLAAIQAACLAELCRRGGGAGALVISDDVLTSVLVDMLWQARTDDGGAGVTLVTAATGNDNHGGNDNGDSDVVGIYSEKEALRTAIVASLSRFKSPGGIVLLVYSLVRTRTVNAVRADVTSSGGELPLINDLGLCTSDLVSLCLRGRADGNVGAYRPVSDENNGENVKLDWAAEESSAFGCGMLSYDVYQTKIPLADGLMSPRYPVWILHGGDHFTVAFAANLEFPETIPVDNGNGNKEVEFSFLHWNGLPPNGPRLVRVRVRTSKPEGTGPAPKKRNAPKHYEPVLGEVESIVQADPEMKRASPDDWTGWRYEVQLAGTETKEEGATHDVRPAGAVLPKTFDVTAYPPAGNSSGGSSSTQWRCAACYSTRFQTMCFGMNDTANCTKKEEDPECENCGRCRSKVGHTIWLTYDELPESWRGSVDRQYAPKIISVLRTKWPGAKVEMVENDSNLWPSV